MKKSSRSSLAIATPAFVFCMFSFFCIVPGKVFSQSDGLPRGCYLMPYTRYESEDGTMGGGAVLHSSPKFNQSDIASEASNQKYVGLPANGAFVSWPVAKTGDGITLRFTIPDSPDGAGLAGSLDVYVNSALVKTISLSSYHAYQYFIMYDSDPKNVAPASGPRTFMRFDEVHFQLAAKLNVGDVIKIQKDNGDAVEYGVDFIEIEQVPAPLPKPAGYLSVTDYGAVADGSQDDSAAFQKCLAAANASHTGVYIPPGTFAINSCLKLDVAHIGIQGAGIWYTNVYFSKNDYFSGGILSGNATTNVDISNIYFNTANNLRWVNGVYRVYKCFMGVYGTNSTIHDIWEEHFECGLWIGGYDEQPIVATDSLLVSHCRIRNNYADGCNFSQGTSNSILEQCSIRNNGDDGMASWPAKDMGNTVECQNLVFRYNTVENNWRAGGAGIFGGMNHQIHHCVFKDGVAGSAIRFTTEYEGFYFQDNTEMKVSEITISGCGTSTDLFDQEHGAVELYGADAAVQNISFQNVDIFNSQRHAVQIGGNLPVSNINFTNTTINGTGLDGITTSAFTGACKGYGIMVFATTGSALFTNVSFANVAMDPPYVNTYPKFDLEFKTSQTRMPVSDAPAKTTFSVFPERGGMCIVLRANGLWPHQSVRCALYDCRGLLVKTETALSDNSGYVRREIDVRLSPGVYTARLSGAGSLSRTFVVRN